MSFSSEYKDRRDAGNNDSGRLSLDNISNNDMIEIKTGNNIYRFVFADASLRQGMLSGGVLNDRPRSAILIGSIIEGADVEVSESSGLQVGGRAVFYILSSAGMERLITSVVISLTLIKSDKKSPFVTDSSDRMLPAQCLMSA
ncbi:MAG: hypothetical protein WBV94_32205 [Blastocatellia bacterium]